MYRMNIWSIKNIWRFEEYSKKERESMESLIIDIINFDIPTSDYTKSCTEYIFEEVDK